MNIKFVIATFILIIATSSIEAQDTAAIGGSKVDRSWNDRAISYIAKGQTWEAIQSFERALRSGRAERRTARENIATYRAELDLPEHSVLHFGWVHGIGRMANIFPPQWWFITAILVLLTGLWMSIRVREAWKYRGVMICLVLSVFLVAIDYCRSQYLKAEDLVIFTGEISLKDKPYASIESSYTVFEGQIATVEQQYGDYCLVTTDTYESGWVLCSNLARIWE